MTEAEMEAMIEKAAAAGARTALREVGLSDEDANSDVKELRNLLDSFRSAKRTVGKTIVQALTTLFLAALMAGAYFNFTDKQ
jgi:predicted xylose isomerase-like sugar epimerase|tara:strand:- start:1828 stop:2073 length:246 start_codon:yes stop_codon:yes gene_type:complete